MLTEGTSFSYDAGIASVVNDRVVPTAAGVETISLSTDSSVSVQVTISDEEVAIVNLASYVVSEYSMASKVFLDILTEIYYFHFL